MPKAAASAGSRPRVERMERSGTLAAERTKWASKDKADDSLELERSQWHQF